MAESRHPSILRNRIKHLFQTYEDYSLTFMKEDQYQERVGERKMKSDRRGNCVHFESTLGKPYDKMFQNRNGFQNLNGSKKESNEKRYCFDIQQEIFEDGNEYYNDIDTSYKNLFYQGLNVGDDPNTEYLLVENYTSIIYESCEDKINILVVNSGLPGGIIEAQIKGKEDFLIPCTYSKNILSFFSPQLEEGVYQLRFFLNKELLFIKLLRDNEKLGEALKSVPLHVIKINDFASSVVEKKDSPNIKRMYKLSKTNNVNTNKELLKIYNSTYKEYGKYENRRDNQIMLGHNYRLQNTNEIDFYSFLKCYSAQFVDHTFRKNNIRKEKSNVYETNRNILNNTNTINFVSPLNLEPNVEQNRIPIMYKKLLYDNCIYENKKIIMQFHNSVFELEPFKVLSVHIFTKSELKDGYSIFAFNLIPLAKNSKNEEVNELLSGTLAFPLIRETEDNSSDFLNETSRITKGNNLITANSLGPSEDNTNYSKYSNNNNRNSARKIRNYMSSLYMFQSDETNCADIRLWKHEETFTCRKNKRADNFYISKEDCCRDVKSPIPPELINNKNIFKKYAEGVQIADNVSIFFEPWNEEVMPVKKFHMLFNTELPLNKIQHVCSLVSGVKDDYFLFDESFNQSDDNSDTEKGSSNYFVESTEQKVEQETKELKETKDLKEAKGLRETKELQKTKRGILEHLRTNFVSFVLVVDGKIYNSVIPISKFLLVFIINFWLHFVSVRKPVI